MALAGTRHTATGRMESLNHLILAVIISAAALTSGVVGQAAISSEVGPKAAPHPLGVMKAAPGPSGVKAAPGPAGLLPANQDALYAQILTEVNWLLDDSARFWLEHGLDEEYGGFKGTTNRQGNASKPFEKGLVAQSRYLWSFARLRETGQLGPEADPVMEDLYTFLVDHFLNDSNSLFWMRVGRNGSRLTLDLGPGFKENVADEEANIRDAGSKQWLYGQAFAIHALAAYARVTNNSEAADIAMSAFRYLDDHFHDKQYGGFDQRKDDGLYIDFYGNTKPSGELGNVEKVVNAHLQYLPAYTELYRTTKDADVAARLYELMDIFATSCQLPICCPVFTPSTGPPSQTRRTMPHLVPRVIVGHELETAEYLSRRGGPQGEPLL
eukprot:jgi/Botrbrau1/440/Bobra.110_2s0089.1